MIEQVYFGHIHGFYSCTACMHINKIWTFSLTMRAYLFQCDGISGSFHLPRLHSRLLRSRPPMHRSALPHFLPARTHPRGRSHRAGCEPNQTRQMQRVFVGRRFSATATREPSARNRPQTVSACMRTSNSDMKYNVRAKRTQQKANTFRRWQYLFAPKIILCARCGFFGDRRKQTVLLANLDWPWESITDVCGAASSEPADNNKTRPNDPPIFSRALQYQCQMRFVILRCWFVLSMLVGKRMRKNDAHRHNEPSGASASKLLAVTNSRVSLITGVRTMLRLCVLCS